MRINLRLFLSQFLVFASSLIGAAPIRADIAPDGAPVVALRVEPSAYNPVVSGSATLTAEASGTEPLSFHWKFNELPIVGATNPVLKLQPLHSTDAGNYRVVVSNHLGVANASATLRPAPWLIWGNEIIQSKGLPDSATNLVAVSAFESQTCGIRGDGTVVVWANANGFDARDLMPPAGLRDVVAVGAAPGYNLALLADGSLRAWGWNAPALALPNNTRDIVAIAVGHQFCLAIRSDGKLLVFGDNPEVRRQAEGIDDAVAISAYVRWGTVRRSDGTVVNLGLNPYPSYEPPFYPPPDGTPPVAAISAAYGHGIALFDDGLPRIVQQPRSVQAIIGANARVVVNAFGEPPLYYQWRYGGIPLRGATNSVLAIDGTALFDAGEYDAVISNAHGAITSAVARISIVTRPPTNARIAVTPVTQAPALGGTATLVAHVDGSAPFAYQWKHNGRVIPGARTATLELRNLGLADAGDYTVIAANMFDQTESAPVRLSVLPVAVWGSNYDSQLEISPAATNVVAIYAGMQHGVALREDGTVVVWGNVPRDSGMLDGGTLQPPAGLSGVVGVAAGSGYNVALMPDGTLRSWGANSFGQRTGLGGWSNIVAVSAGHTHTLALRADGTILRAGWNNEGQLDLPREESYVGVAAGYQFSVGLRSDGTVVQAGREAPTVPPDATNIVAISAGQYHVLAMRADGTLVGWGPGAWTPDQFQGEAVVAFHAGGRHSLAILSDGRVVSWGDNWLGQTDVPIHGLPAIGVGAGFAHSIALIGSGPPRVLQQPLSSSATIGGNLRMAVSATGSLPLHYQWRRDGEEIPGATRPMFALDSVSLFDTGQYDVVVANSFGSITSRVATVTVSWRAPSRVTAYIQPTNHLSYLGGTAQLTAISDGSPPMGYKWQSIDHPGFSARGSSLTLNKLTFEDSGNYAAIAANSLGSVTSALVRLSVLNVAVWGGREAGTDTSAVFDPPASLTNVIAISASQWNGLALRVDGTAIGWGDPFGGKLPIPADAANLIALAAGGEFNLGLRSDGTVVVWGDNRNNYGIKSLPRALTNVVQISAAYSWALALKGDGTVVQWGTYIGGSMKPPPPGLSNVVQVSAGARHALALVEDGHVVGWGSDDLSQMTPPPQLDHVISVVAGNSYSMALRDDGTVVEWGRDARTPPAEATDLVAIASGNFHRVGLRADGTVVSWGFENGGLGQTRVPQDLPRISAIAAAGDVTMALISISGAPEIARQPRSQNLYAGDELRLEATVFPGSAGLKYQWFKDGHGVPDATNSALIIASTAASDAGRYSVEVRNAAGTKISREAEVIVTDSAPVLVAGPGDVLTYSGGTAEFSVEAVGSRPMTFQWFHNEIAVPRATNRTLAIASAESTDAGSWSVEVRNSTGAVVSPPALLRLAPSVSLVTGEIFVTPSGRFTVAVHVSQPLGEDVRVRFAYPIWGGEPAQLAPSREGFLVVPAGMTEQSATFIDPPLYQMASEAFRPGYYLQLLPGDLPVDAATARARLTPRDTADDDTTNPPQRAIPRFEPGGIRRRPDGAVELLFLKEPGSDFWIETSPNMRDWRTVSGKPALDSSGRQVWFIEPEAGDFPARFYRVVMP